MCNVHKRTTSGTFAAAALKASRVRWIIPVKADAYAKKNRRPRENARKSSIAMPEERLHANKLQLTKLSTNRTVATMPRRYDAEMFEVLKHGSVRRVFTGGRAVILP